MGTITGDDIISRALKTLLDETGAYWELPEIGVHMASAITALVTAKPDAYTKTVEVELVAGTKQSIPDDGVTLIEVQRNLNDGVPGRAIRRTNMSVLDRTNPNWHAMAASPVVQEYMYDQRNLKVFWVYPPMAVEPGSVEMTYAAVPPRYEETSDPIPLDDIYEDPLNFYLLSECYAKNTKRGDVTKSQSYRQMFYNALGITSKGESDVGATRSPEAAA